MVQTSWGDGARGGPPPPGAGGFLGEEEDGEDGMAPGNHRATLVGDRRGHRRRFRLTIISTDP